MSFAYWSRNNRLLDTGDTRAPRPDQNETISETPRNAVTSPAQPEMPRPRGDLNVSLKMDVDIDNDLQCPICLELYTYPIILPCSHVLCRAPCAEHLFDFNFIRCPVCRDNCYVSGGISSLPRVLALENIIERYKTERKNDRSTLNSSSLSTNPTPETSDDTPTKVSRDCDVAVLRVARCQHCKGSIPKRAKKLCLTCDSTFCGTCLRLTHPNREPFTSHEFTEPNGKIDTQPAVTLNKKPGSRSSGSGGPQCGSSRPNVPNSYCRTCKLPFAVNSADRELHSGHTVISLDDAYREVKGSIDDNVEKLTSGQAKVTTCLKVMKDGLKDMQHVLARRRDEINMQCDALLAEIENKRSFFLADLDYEERVQQNVAEDHIKTLEKVLGSSQGLQNYVHDVVSSDRAPFLEIASTLNERVVKAAADCDTAGSVPALDLASLRGKVVDCRREKTLLRELHYLNPPSTPIVDVTRCSRSEDAVILALCPPNSVHDVVDQYDVHFCSEEQKNIELEETMIVKNSADDAMSVKLSANSAGILVLLIENLCRATTYYFCLSASNLAGKSPSSEVVQCTTLAQGESVIPEPTIAESQCKCFTSSIQISSTSPIDVAPEQKISHFLLYRHPSQNRTWKCVSMYGREDHRVFGLDSNSEYEFVILAYNLRGECQLSNKVVLQTEVSASY